MAEVRDEHRRTEPDAFGSYRRERGDHPDVGVERGRVEEPRPLVAEPLGLARCDRRRRGWAETRRRAPSARMLRATRAASGERAGTVGSPPMGDRLAGKTAIVTGGRARIRCGDRAALRRRGRERGRSPTCSTTGRATAERSGRGRATCTATSRARTTGPRWSSRSTHVDVLVNNAAVLVLAQHRQHHRCRLPPRVRGERARHVPRHPRRDRADARRGGGSIVNISSIDGVFVTPGTAAYAAEQVRGARPHQDRRARARSAPHPRATPCAPRPATWRWSSRRCRPTSISTR